MTQNFSIGTPELAGFGVLGGTAGAALSNWLVSDAHIAVGCVAGAVALPVLCTLPQLIAASARCTARLSQFALLQLGGGRWAKSDNPA